MRTEMGKRIRQEEIKKGGNPERERRKRRETKSYKPQTGIC
jgi:hypothetical protein